MEKHLHRRRHRELRSPQSAKVGALRLEEAAQLGERGVLRGCSHSCLQLEKMANGLVLPVEDQLASLGLPEDVEVRVSAGRRYEMAAVDRLGPVVPGQDVAAPAMNVGRVRARGLDEDAH